MGKQIPIEALGERVLVKVVENLEIKVGEFVQDIEETSMLAKRGIVVNIGGDVDMEKINISEGDMIFHSVALPDTIAFDEEFYFFVTPKELISKIKKDRITELFA